MKHLHRTGTKYTPVAVPHADRLQVFLHLVDVELGVRVEQAERNLTSKERQWSITLACREGNACGEAVSGEHRGNDVPLLQAYRLAMFMVLGLVWISKCRVSGLGDWFTVEWTA